MANDSNEDNRKRTSQPIPIDDKEQWWLKFVPDSNQWSDVNISRFLNIYRTLPILWDPRHSVHKDHTSRMKAYDLIAKKLNLHGIRATECIKLVKTLKDLYAKEKDRQMIVAERCSQKYTPPPTWYHVLKELLDSIQEKLANPDRKDSLLAKVDPAKPWKACCEKLYIEDIWTPEHFKTNVMDWFFAPQDERLLCTCQEFAITNREDICSTETSSTNDADLISNFSNKIDQCSTDESFFSFETCCFNTKSSKAPELRGADRSNDELEICDYRIPKKKVKMPSFCNSYDINETNICGGEKIKNVKIPFKNEARCSSVNVEQWDTNVESSSAEVMNSEVKCCDFRDSLGESTCCDTSEYNNSISTINKKCKIKKKKQHRESKLVRCKNSETILKEDDILDVCGSEDVPESICAKNKKLLEETCGFKYRNKSLPCGRGTELNEQDRYGSRNNTSEFGFYEKNEEKPCPGLKKLPEFRNIRVTTCGNEGSVASSVSEISRIVKSHDTCCSDCNKVASMASESSSHTSSILLECKSLSEKENRSDNRLEYHPDPTLCEKCAVDRMPVPEARKNIINFEDPRMLDLDKYCRYKDWDTIYNIRTQVPDEEPIFQINEDLLFITKTVDKPVLQKNQNYSPTEADINLFIKPESSEARQVNLNDEYKWEYGLKIKIDQPKHYACEIPETLYHKPAQLIL